MVKYLALLECMIPDLGTVLMGHVYTVIFIIYLVDLVGSDLGSGVDI